MSETVRLGSMTGDLGLCVSKDAMVMADKLQALGSQWARWTFDPEHERAQVAYCKALKALGIKRFGTCDADTYRAFGDPLHSDTWVEAHRWLANTFSGYVDVVNPVNEPDGAGFESSTMPVDAVNKIIRIARAEWPASIKLVGVGSVSGQASYYNDIDYHLLDGIDFHPYAKWPPVYNPEPGFRMADIVREHEAFGRPLWISEVGLNSDEVGEEEQARYLRTTMAYLRDQPSIVASFWFCAHAYAGWGLWRSDGSQKPSYDAFKATAGITKVDDCERYRQALLSSLAYVKSRPQRDIKKKKLLELLGAA